MPCGCLAAGLLSCSSGELESGVVASRQAVVIPASATLTLSAPHSLDPTAPLLEAQNSVIIGPLATVSGATVALGTGPQGINAAPLVTMADAWSRGGVNLGPLLQLTGTLHAGTVVADPTATVTTSDRSPIFDPLSTASWNVTFPSVLSAGIHASSGQTASVSPGGYSSLVVDAGANVTLHSGTYFFTNLTVSSGANVQLDQSGGPIVIYVSDVIAINATLQSTAHDAPNLLVGYIGSGAVALGAASPRIRVGSRFGRVPTSRRLRAPDSFYAPWRG